MEYIYPIYPMVSGVTLALRQVYDWLRDNDATLTGVDEIDL